MLHSLKNDWLEITTLTALNRRCLEKALTDIHLNLKTRLKRQITRVKQGITATDAASFTACQKSHFARADRFILSRRRKSKSLE
jgi:hypothetical protein